MKKKLLGSILLSTLLILSACSSKKNIDLELKPLSDNNKITIVVKSNLPEGTKASLTLINRETGYIGQEAFQIKGQETRSEEFTNQGQPLDSGSYSLTLVIPVTEAQPEEVITVLGENFKNIESEHLTELDEYKYLEKNITFTID